MTYIIAEPCVSTCDTACVEVCPVDCIHGPEDREGMGEEPSERKNYNYTGFSYEKKPPKTQFFVMIELSHDSDIVKNRISGKKCL